MIVKNIRLMLCQIASIAHTQDNALNFRVIVSVRVIVSIR